MTPVGFKPTISADKLPQTYILGRAAMSTDIVLNTLYKMINIIIIIIIIMSYGIAIVTRLNLP
jgi:hypothetical protein